jgi:hypothetical protein
MTEGQPLIPAIADSMDQEVSMDYRGPAPKSECHGCQRGQRRRASSTSENAQRARLDPSLPHGIETW